MLTFHSDSYEIHVCQDIFLNTPSIPKTMIKTAFSKKNQDGGIEADKRVKHKNQNCVYQQRENQVINHIKTLKVLKSHYVQKNPQKTTTSKFLPSEMSIKEMHRLYIEYCNKNNYEVQSQKKIKNECNHCTSYKNLQVLT